MFVTTVLGLILGSVVPSDIIVFVVSKVPLQLVRISELAAVVTPTVTTKFCPRPFDPSAAVSVSPI